MQTLITLAGLVDLNEVAQQNALVHCAVVKKWYKLTYILVEKLKDPFAICTDSTSTYYTSSPAHYLTTEDLIKLFIEKGADFNVPSNKFHGATPAMEIVGKDILHFQLLYPRIKPELVDNNQSNILHHAFSIRRNSFYSFQQPCQYNNISVNNLTWIFKEEPLVKQLLKPNKLNYIPVINLITSYLDYLNNLVSCIESAIPNFWELELVNGKRPIELLALHKSAFSKILASCDLNKVGMRVPIPHMILFENCMDCDSILFHSATIKHYNIEMNIGDEPHNALSLYLLYSPNHKKFSQLLNFGAKLPEKLDISLKLMNEGRLKVLAQSVDVLGISKSQIASAISEYQIDKEDCEYFIEIFNKLKGDTKETWSEALIKHSALTDVFKHFPIVVKDVLLKESQEATQALVKTVCGETDDEGNNCIHLIVACENINQKDQGLIITSLIELGMSLDVLKSKNNNGKTVEDMSKSKKVLNKMIKDAMGGKESKRSVAKNEGEKRQKK